LVKIDLKLNKDFALKGDEHYIKEELGGLSIRWYENGNKNSDIYYKNEGELPFGLKSEN